MIKDFTLKILDNIIIELNKENNKTKIQEKIIDPIISYIYLKLFNSFITIIILFIIITFLSIINFIIILTIYFKK